jgi:putrescine transport system permease protein
VYNRISPFLISILCIGIALLYIPMLVLIGYSFNASPLVSVWGGFSTSWYTQLIHNDQILDAAWLSLKIGVMVSTGALILGTLAAIALVRFKLFRGRLLLTGMVNAPLVMPEIVTGITQLLLFISMLQLFGWPHRGITTIVIAHIAFCTAYVTITVQSRLDSADRSLEEAVRYGPSSTPPCRPSPRRWHRAGCSASRSPWMIWSSPVSSPVPAPALSRW